MKAASITTGLEAAGRFLARADAAEKLVAATPEWSTSSLHSSIRYLRSDAHVAGSAVAKLDGGRSLGAQLKSVGDRLDEISGWLDGAARSAGPFDISDATRVEFQGLLRDPLTSARLLGGATRSALEEAATGATRVDIRHAIA